MALQGGICRVSRGIAGLSRQSHHVRRTTPAVHGPALAHEQRDTGRPGRVHRRVGDRDAHEVDEGEREADRDRRETRARAPRRGPDDDHQEDRGECDFGNQTSEK